MEKHTIVEFYRPHNRYKVMSEKSKMKHPETGDWIDSIIYQEYQILVDGEYVDSKEQNVYVREKKDFLTKFYPVLDL